MDHSYSSGRSHNTLCYSYSTRWNAQGTQSSPRPIAATVFESGGTNWRFQYSIEPFLNELGNGPTANGNVRDAHNIAELTWHK